MRPLTVQPDPGPASALVCPQLTRVDEYAREMLVRARELLLPGSRNASRAMEAGHTPSHTVPREDVVIGRLSPAAAHSFREWKAQARCSDHHSGNAFLRNAVRTHEQIAPAHVQFRGVLAFYPDRIERLAGGERVRVQAGSFYGGRISKDRAGALKGEAAREAGKNRARECVRNHAGSPELEIEDLHAT